MNLGQAAKRIIKPLFLRARTCFYALAARTHKLHHRPLRPARPPLPCAHAEAASQRADLERQLAAAHDSADRQLREATQRAADAERARDEAIAEAAAAGERAERAERARATGAQEVAALTESTEVSFMR